MNDRYPTISPKDFDAWLNLIREGHATAKPAPKVPASAALEASISNLRVELLRIINDLDSSDSSDKFNKFEIEASGLVRQFVDDLSRNEKMDPGFWSYLGAELFEVINWRHSITTDGKKASHANFGADKTKSDYFLLIRLYLRDRLSETTAHKAMGDQDVWNSHIIRVQTAKNVSVVAALLEKARDSGKSGTQIRDEAKTMKALRANIVTEVMDKQQAKDFVDLAFDLT